MPTIIDALVVTLGLDPSGFKKGQAETQEALKKTRDATEKHTKEMEARAKAITGAFTKMAAAFLPFVTIGAAASRFKQFVEQITVADAATGRLATNVNATTRGLSTWQGMAAKFGGTADDMNAAFNTAAKISKELQSNGGSAALGPLARLLGGDFGAFVGLAKAGDTEGMMAMLQRSVVNAPNKMTALQFMGEAGFSDTTVTVMREIGDQLAQQLQLQQQRLAITDRDAKLAQERQEAMSRISDALGNLGRAIVNSRFIELIGMLNRLASILERWAYDPAAPGATRPYTPEELKAVREGKPMRSSALAAPPTAAFILNRGKASAESPEARALRAGGITPGFMAADDARRSSPAAVADDLQQLRAEMQRRQTPQAMAILQQEYQRLTSLAGGGAALSGGGSSTSITVDTINVVTQATDAMGIAHDIKDALRQQQHLTASHGNAGQR